VAVEGRLVYLSYEGPGGDELVGPIEVGALPAVIDDILAGLFCEAGLASELERAERVRRVAGNVILDVAGELGVEGLTEWLKPFEERLRHVASRALELADEVAKAPCQGLHSLQATDARFRLREGGTPRASQAVQLLRPRRLCAQGPQPRNKAHSQGPRG
jgi:hypothetical protein